ncbi:unnamed protein product [Alopecurus aequalis]
MSNPCKCCQSKLRFIRQINGNFMYSLVIPKWFLNYFGGKIPGTVKLEGPNGITYDVGVRKNINRTILKSGWAAFVDTNQILENDSLMFRYLGNARFEVTIFDSNGKEKALSCGGKGTASDVKKPSRHDVDNSRSSRDDTTQSSAGKGSDSDGCPEESSCPDCKLAKTPTLSYTTEESSDEEHPSLDDSVESDDRQLRSDNYVLSGRYDLTEAQEFEISALVEKIRPKIPVLVVLIKKSNLIQHRRLDYALKYFPREDTNIALQLPRKNKIWECKFHIRPSGVSCAGRCDLSCSKFICDNNVREGDICLFQPMTSVKQRRFIITVHLLDKVSIDHSPGGRKSTEMDGAKEEPPSDGEEYSSEHEDHGVSDDSEGFSEPPFMLPIRQCLTAAQEKKVMEKYEEIEPDLPFYVAIINKSNVYQRVRHTPFLHFGSQYAARYLGEKFSAGHRHGNSIMISLVLQRERKSRSWPTELCQQMRHSGLQFKILKGWTSFVRDNRLRKGDLCLFKLMKNEEPLKMMVYIIRREEC